ncbi:MAG: DUF2189 domain-containing protein [Rhodoferax sp.]
MALDNTPTTMIRQVTVLQSLQWLVLGMRDLVQLRWISLAHGFVLALSGAVIALIAYDRFWLLAGALSGFLFVAPVLAASLYALSRDLENKQSIGWITIWHTWTRWQLSHEDKRSNDYWCMVQFGLLLAVAATGWVLTSAALITLLSPIAIHSPLDFLRFVVGAKEGYLFEIWLALGGFMAAPIFASSVVTMPLLLDRRISLLQAVLISWSVVLKNPVPMAVWAAILLVMSLLGLCSLLLGIVAVVPLLGHASWHAYRDLVDTRCLPRRQQDSAPVSVAVNR